MLNYNFFYKPINQQSNAISNESWSNKLNQLNLSKSWVAYSCASCASLTPFPYSQLNKLVLDYLIIEGYTDAATKFSKDTGIDMDSSTNLIKDRKSIKDLIRNGEISPAIDLINEINPDILDQNTELYFNLQLQQLIEFIRRKQTNQALEFAQTVLSHLAITIPSLLPSLEMTLTLLAFNSPDSEEYAQATDAPSNIRQLLSQSQREKVASMVNKHVLESEFHSNEPKLSNVIKLLSWGENALASRVSFPRYQPPLHKHGNNHNEKSNTDDINRFGQFDQQMLT